VLIYFDRETQRRLCERFATYLHSGGYLFLGHSESLVGLTERFLPLRGTTYRLRTDHTT
jgi:chemotaxis protein methyltransferase CheR